MSTLADRVIADLRTHQDDLAARVATLGDDDLATTSGSSDWDVAQVLSHLGSGSVIMLAGLTAAVQGVPGPGQDFNVGVWARWDAMTNAQKRDEYLVANPRLVQAFEDLDGGTRASLEVPLSWRPHPLDTATFAGLRLNEVALHRWDIDVAVDPGATVSAASGGVLAQLYLGPLGFLVARWGRPDGVVVAAVSVLVELTDPASRFGLTLRPDGVDLSAQPPATPDATLRLPAEAWARLLTGRLAPGHTPAGVDTDGIDLAVLRQVFAGF